MLEDPLPGQMRKQLVVKIISGQQLPKPKDSMLGDRGEVKAKPKTFLSMPFFDHSIVFKLFVYFRWGGFSYKLYICNTLCLKVTFLKNNFLCNCNLLFAKVNGRKMALLCFLDH